MKNLSTVLVAIVASFVVAGTAVGDQTEADQRASFDSEYLDNGE